VIASGSGAIASFTSLPIFARREETIFAGSELTSAATVSPSARKPARSRPLVFAFAAAKRAAILGEMPSGSWASGSSASKRSKWLSASSPLPSVTETWPASRKMAMRSSLWLPPERQARSASAAASS